MQISNNYALTFDDVLLEPQYSEVMSRSLVDTGTWLGDNLIFRTPIISANMDSITEYDMAMAMDSVGGLGIVHRFMTIEDQVEIINKFKWSNGSRIGAAIGVKSDCIERSKACIEAGADTLVLDIAHAHSKMAADTIESIKSEYPNVHITAGNVATYDGAKFLCEIGADAVKVGIGNGGTCITRIVAGVGVPQITAIMECARACDEHHIPLIADGGIRYPGDVAKAIAAGADAVMVGRLLSGTIESPGRIVEKDGRLFKAYRGMASSGAMERRREVELRNGYTQDSKTITSHITPEGIETLVPFTNKSSIDVVLDLVGGLRSAMSYSNSMTISEFQSKAKFIQMTNSGLVESHPHATTA